MKYIMLGIAFILAGIGFACLGSLMRNWYAFRNFAGYCNLFSVCCLIIGLVVSICGVFVNKDKGNK